MRKSERRMILLLIIVSIIIISILVKVKGGKQGEAGEGQASKEDYVQVMDDGTKVNKSKKIDEKKKFDNFEMTNIQITENGGQSTIIADVKNVGDTRTEVTLIDITLLDEEGNEIAVIGGIIGDVEPGGTTQLNASATTDFANAYDLTVKVSGGMDNSEAPVEETQEQE